MSKHQDLNMTRVWRDELKTLRKNKRKVLADDKALCREIRKKQNALERKSQQSLRATSKALTTINRRIAILEGRLS